MDQHESQYVEVPTSIGAESPEAAVVTIGIDPLSPDHGTKRFILQRVEIEADKPLVVLSCTIERSPLLHAKLDGNRVEILIASEGVPLTTFPLECKQLVDVQHSVVSVRLRNDAKKTVRARLRILGENRVHDPEQHPIHQHIPPLAITPVT